MTFKDFELWNREWLSIEIEIAASIHFPMRNFKNLL